VESENLVTLRVTSGSSQPLGLSVLFDKMKSDNSCLVHHEKWL